MLIYEVTTIQIYESHEKDENGKPAFYGEETQKFRFEDIDAAAAFADTAAHRSLNFKSAVISIIKLDEAGNAAEEQEA